MDRRDQFAEVIAMYRRYGWQLRRALLREKTRSETSGDPDLFAKLPIHDAPIDALWFSRTSAKAREAWELRLVAETPYALFEAFEPDETEEQREEARLEMEARMREYVATE